MNDARMTAIRLHDDLLARQPADARHDATACALCDPIAREVAMSGAAPPTVRTFSEEEKDALVQDAITRETATLHEELAGLRTQLDTLTAEKLTATAERDAARSELDAYRAEVAAQQEAAARKTARVAEIREAAGSLREEFFTAERAERWAHLSDEEFAALKAELSEIAATAQPGGPVPRETAMTGQTPATRRDQQPSHAKQFLLGTRAAPTT